MILSTLVIPFIWAAAAFLPRHPHPDEDRLRDTAMNLMDSIERT